MLEAFLDGVAFSFGVILVVMVFGLFAKRSQNNDNPVGELIRRNDLTVEQNDILRDIAQILNSKRDR